MSEILIKQYKIWPSLPFDVMQKKITERLYKLDKKYLIKMYSIDFDGVFIVKVVKRRCPLKK